MKRFGRIVLVSAVIMVGAVVAAAAFANWLNTAPVNAEDGDAVQLSIESGDSVSSVAFRLQESGAIRNRYFFRLISKLQGTEADIRRGIYNIEPGMTSLEIHDLLIEGKQRLFKVTIPEGLTARKIGEVLDEAGIVDAGEFAEAVAEYEPREGFGRNPGGAEGFLFPDTYLFQKDYPAEKVVEHLVGSFFAALGKVYPDFQELEADTLFDTLVLASIVEREYRISEEAPLIASVFLNRLEIGMPLQSCATVVYVLSEELGQPHPERITFRDLEVESFYNTYRNGGLPPGPICNPGYTALDAAFNPAESDYLFFVLKNPQTGEHFFSRDYGDHDRAYQLYIKER